MSNASKETKFFKLRFKPTGKFYKPATGYTWEKNNLSPTGKTYSKKAITFRDVSMIYVLKTVLPERENISHNSRDHYNWKGIKTTPEDWEWVEYEVVEKQVHSL